MEPSIFGQTPVQRDINKPARGFQQDLACGTTSMSRLSKLFMTVLALVIVPAIMGILSPRLLAQSITGDIVVTVTDPTGAVLPKASLVLTQVDTAQQTTLASDSSGLGVFAQLKPGAYKLSVSAAGFKSTQLDNITVVPCWERVRINSQVIRRAAGSSPVVGSSRNSNNGFPTIPRPISSRRCCPPESFFTLTSALSRSPTSSITSSTARGSG